MLICLIDVCFKWIVCLGDMIDFYVLIEEELLGVYFLLVKIEVGGKVVVRYWFVCMFVSVEMEDV